MDDFELLVTPSEFQNTATEIENHKNALNNLMEDMQNKINSLSGVWQSETAESYKNMYKNVSNNVQGALDQLKKRIDILKDLAVHYEALEKKENEKAQGLSTENIFS